MGSTTHFSLDILIVLLFAFIIILSWQKGFYKTLRLFITLILVVVGLQIGSNVLFDFLRSSTHLSIFQSMSFIFLGNPGLISSKNVLLTMLTYIVFFLVMWLVVYICMLPFRKSREKELVHIPKKWSVIMSIILGTVNSVIVLNVFIFSMMFVVPVQNNHIITNLFINQMGTVSTIQTLNRLEIEIEPTYEKLQLAEETITGRAYQESIIKLQEIKEQVYVIDQHIADIIIPLLESPLSYTLINEHLPSNNFTVMGYTYALVQMSNRKSIYEIIIDQEKNNTQLEAIQMHLDWLLKHQLLVRVLFMLEADLEEASLENIGQSIDSINNSIKNNKHRSADISIYDKVTRPISEFYVLKDSIAQWFGLDHNHLSIEDLIEELKGKMRDPIALQLAASNFTLGEVLNTNEKNKITVDAIKVFFNLVESHIEGFTAVDYLYPSLALLSHEYKILSSLREKIYTSLLINSWMNDVFENTKDVSSFLFHYILLYVWMDVENRTIAISQSDMDGILAKVQTDFETHSYLSLQAVTMAFDNFVMHRQGLQHLLEEGIYSPDVVHSFTASQWSFISDEAKVYIQNFIH